MRKYWKVNDKKVNLSSFNKFIKPAIHLEYTAPAYVPNTNRPVKLDIKTMLKTLVYYHLDNFDSGRHLIQAVNERVFGKAAISVSGIRKSTFFDAINSRGLEQLIYIYEKLISKAFKRLPSEFRKLGILKAIDGSLIDSTLSMYWADYRDNSKKAKIHLGYDINKSIPAKCFITDGKADERLFVEGILNKGETGVMDRYYQCYDWFDHWHENDKFFVCRIKKKSIITEVESFPTKEDSIVSYDAIAFLGNKYIKQTKNSYRVVKYHVDGKEFLIATNRFDLSAEEIAQIYKLRWQIENFFAWWKRHIGVYHLIARSKYGFMVQIISGLITYLLMAIYCREQYGEPVTVVRARTIVNQIFNELVLAKSSSRRNSKLYRRRRSCKTSAIF